MRLSSIPLVVCCAGLAGLVAWIVAGSPVWGEEGQYLPAGPGGSFTRADLSAAITPAASGSATAAHRVHYRTPAGPPVVVTGLTDHAGQPVTIACATCHTSRPANFANKTTQDLDLFHQGLAFAHGPKQADGALAPDSPVSCLSCHNPLDYGSLRLANGRRVEFTEVMQLCAQCHGPQYRNYQHGAHGGKNGAWALAYGDQQRNTCVSCHDPHAPKYRGVTPVLPPADRFISPPAHGSGHE